MSVVDELRVIAAEIRKLRPDWDYDGILTQLAKHRGKGTLDELRNAAIKATRNGHAKTPAAIGFPASWTPDPERGDNVGGYDPLPECARCQLPVPRHVADRLEECPGCSAVWVANDLAAVESDRQLALDEHAPARLGKSRFEAVRARIGRRIPTPGDPDLTRATRAVRCPWCAVPPGAPCVVLGSGRDVVDPKTGRTLGKGPDKLLTHAVAHPMRFEAAGTGRVVLDLVQLATLRGPRAPAGPTPHTGNEGEQLTDAEIDEQEHDHEQ